MKRTILLILIVVLFSTSVLTAQTQRYSHQKFDSEYFSDGWNSIHFVGTAYVTTLLRVKANMTPIQAGVAAALLNIAWDFGDEAYASLRTGPSKLDMIFDKKGKDWRDMLMGCGGAITGNIILGLRVKKDSFMVTANIKLN